MKKVFFIVVFIPKILFAQTTYSSLVSEGISDLKLGKYESALTYLQKALKFDSSNVDVNYGLGIIFCKHCQDARKDCIESLYYLNKVIKLNGYYRKVLYNRGLVYASMNNDKSALQDFNKYITLNPDDTLCLLSRGTLKVTLGDKTGGCSDYNKAKLNGSSLAIRLINSVCNR